MNWLWHNPFTRFLDAHLIGCDEWYRHASKSHDAGDCANTVMWRDGSGLGVAIVTAVLIALVWAAVGYLQESGRETWDRDATFTAILGSLAVAIFWIPALYVITYAAIPATVAALFVWSAARGGRKLALAHRSQRIARAERTPEALAALEREADLALAFVGVSPTGEALPPPPPPSTAVALYPRSAAASHFTSDRIVELNGCYVELGRINYGVIERS